jgi:hypothetical protein
VDSIDTAVQADNNMESVYRLDTELVHYAWDKDLVYRLDTELVQYAWDKKSIGCWYVYMYVCIVCMLG